MFLLHRHPGFGFGTYRPGRRSFSSHEWEVTLRLILFFAVIALAVDAYFYSGAHTRSAYTQVSIAARHFVAYIGDAVDDAAPEHQSSRVPTRI